MNVPHFARQMMISTVAYVVGLLGALLAILALVDIKSVGLDSGLPTVAMTTPMLAVVIFWAVARVLGAKIAPDRTFLFGGIAINSLLYVCGRLVANGLFSNVAATIMGAIALFALAYLATGPNQEKGR